MPSLALVPADLLVLRPDVAVLRSPAEVAALAPEWRALHAGTPEATGFQAEEWCRAWLAAAPGACPRLVAVREHGRLVMLWPLAVSRRLGLRVAHWLGEPLTQYGDALALASPRRPTWFAAAWETMRAWDDVDVLEFGRVREDAVIARFLPPSTRVGSEGVLGAHALAVASPTGSELVAPYVHLRSEGAGARSQRTLRSLRRRLKKLEEIGPVRFTLRAEGGEARRLAGECLRLKAEWLRARGLLSTGLGHPAAEAMLAAAAGEGALAVAAIEVGGRVAAAEIGLVAGARYGSFLTGYDPDFAAGAPGQLLTLRLFEECAARGLTTYDFLPPADAYKLEWASGRVALRHHRAPLTLAGRAMGALGDLRPALKRSYYSLPPVLRGLGARLLAH